MPKRRADADQRRFLDEFQHVKASYFRARGVIDPAKNVAVIPMGGKERLLGVKHTRFWNSGGFSYFVCPGCARRASRLYLVADTPRCVKCCEALNIQHRNRYGFGRQERMRSADLSLDQLIAKLETPERLSLKPAPKSWRGKAQLVYRSRCLTERMRRRMVVLRLNQLASQHEVGNGALKLTRAYKPRKEALAAIPELEQVWRARTHERLQQALDNIQCTLLKALESDDPRQRLSAARIMLKTKQARERGFRG
jgi:hypothetical protein